MLSLFANSALLKRFLHFVGLVPVILRFVEIAEASGKNGPEKRAFVIRAVQRMVTELIKRSYLPDEMEEGLVKTAGDLTDAIVSVYNASGVFTRSVPIERNHQKEATQHDGRHSPNWSMGPNFPI